MTAYLPPESDSPLVNAGVLIKTQWTGATAPEERQMFKRALLVFTFVAALGAGSKAMAWNDCYDDVDVYRYPEYASYYSGYSPRVVYYRTYPVRAYPVYYGHGYDRYRHHYDHHNHHGHDGHRGHQGHHGHHHNG